MDSNVSVFQSSAISRRYDRYMLSLKHDKHAHDSSIDGNRNEARVPGILTKEQQRRDRMVETSLHDNCIFADYQINEDFLLKAILSSFIPGILIHFTLHDGVTSVGVVLEEPMLPSIKVSDGQLERTIPLSFVQRHPISIDLILSAYYEHQEQLRSGACITAVYSSVLHQIKNNAEGVRQRQWSGEKMSYLFRSVDLYGSDIQKVHASVQSMAQKSLPSRRESGGGDSRSLKETIELFYLYENILPCEKDNDEVEASKITLKQRRQHVQKLSTLAEKMNQQF